MTKPSARNILSGTHATTWWDGDICYENSKIEVKISTNRETITFAGDMMEDSKLMSASGTITITVRKVYSRAAQYAEAIMEGKDPRATIIAKIDDPDAWGHERVQVSNVWFDEIPVFSAENGSIVEEEYSGGFTGLKFLDKIEAK